MSRFLNKAFIKSLYSVYPFLESIVKKIKSEHGIVFVVGGAVRDFFLERPLHDIDLEVHGLSPHQLEGILSEFSAVSLVGKQFGVYKVAALPYVDWGLPRVDGVGRHPEVLIDIYMPIETSLARRDLRMNAMAVEITKEPLVIYDPFDGQKDIKDRVLQPTNDVFFKEDPLRLFRVMRYHAVLEMSVDEKLTDMCRTMSIDGVSKERIINEFVRMLIESQAPSRGLYWLDEIQKLKEVLPFLESAKKESVKDGTLENMFFYICAFLDHTKNILLDGDLTYIKELTLVTLVVFSKEYSEFKEALYQILGNVKTKYIKKLWSIAQAVHIFMKPAQSKEYIFMIKKHASILDRYGFSWSICLPLLKSYSRFVALYDRYDDFVDILEQNNVLSSFEDSVIKGNDILSMCKNGVQCGLILDAVYSYQLKENIRDREKLLEYAKRLLINE